MKVAHLVVITPGRCGLYETTRECVTALRARDVDARMVDPTEATNMLHPGGVEDRGAPFASVDWATHADLLVNHSGLGEVLEATTTPIVHVAHGRPRSSFLTEAAGGTPIYSYHYQQDASTRTTDVVTFWPDHEPYLRVMWPRTRVHVVSPPVDLDAWTPDGPRGYQFHGQRGRVNVVCTDAWRDDIDPFTAVNAFALWARKVEGAKLHMYAVHKDRRGWQALWKRLQDDGTLGERRPWVSGLANVYRAADVLLTPHAIATRATREAMACGCPVVWTPSPECGTEIDRALATSRAEVRRSAEQRFDPARSARGLSDVFQQALGRAAA